jgi:hypothetical protein
VKGLDLISRTLDPAGQPSRLKTIAAGQKPVKADCSKFAPTNTVSSSHHGDTKWASATDASTITPANANTAWSTFIYFSHA